MKNSFFSRFTPKEPKFFPLLKQLSEILLSSSALLIEILGHDSPEKRAEDYKRIKDLEREGDKLTNLILDELGTTFITPFDREDIHDLASGMDDVIDGINSCAKRITIYNPHPISDKGFWRIQSVWQAINISLSWARPTTWTVDQSAISYPGR